MIENQFVSQNDSKTKNIIDNCCGFDLYFICGHKVHKSKLKNVNNYLFPNNFQWNKKLLLLRLWLKCNKQSKFISNDNCNKFLSVATFNTDRRHTFVTSRCVKFCRHAQIVVRIGLYFYTSNRQRWKRSSV